MGGPAPPPIPIAPQTLYLHVYVHCGILRLGHRMRFEYDEQKNEYNLARHGVDLKKLTNEQKRRAAVIAAKADADIDFTDAREVVDWSGAEIGKFYRPPKKPVTMRLDVDIIKWLKSDGRGYQTRVNALLRHAMNSRSAARHEDEALRQKAQAAYHGLHAKRASGNIKRIHADKLRARMNDDIRPSAPVRLR
jgi:uncharacterized protein (DUF4415 family)